MENVQLNGSVADERLLSFVADHMLELTPSYKPHSSGKAFLCDFVPVTPITDEQGQIPRYAQLERAVFCVPPGQWRHMRQLL